MHVRSPVCLVCMLLRLFVHSQGGRLVPQSTVPVPVLPKPSPLLSRVNFAETFVLVNSTQQQPTSLDS